MFSENGELVDEMFRRWRENPESVDDTWRAFFAGMQFAGRVGGLAEPAAGVTPPAADLRTQTGAVRLVYWYRQAGHLQAHTDPLSPPPPPNPLLGLANF